MGPQTLVCLAVGVGFATAYEAQFFYTPIFDRCQFSGVSGVAGGLSAHGSVCAYVNETTRIYSCPAPDRICWNYHQTCSAGAEKPGPQQIKCQRGSTVWCCTSDETCTTTPNQVNICFSNFTNPNIGIDIPTANKNALIALGASSVTATIQTADPTPFSTQTFWSSTTATTSTMASSTTSATSSIVLSTPTTGVPQSSSSADVEVTSSSRLSAGAIAGIVVGIVAGLGFTGFVARFLYRGRRLHSQGSGPAYHLATELEHKPSLTGYYGKIEMPEGGKEGFHARYELST